MNAPVKTKKIFTESEQREITRQCMCVAQQLMQHGAESALVESVATRLGLALGMDRVEISITANALSLSTLTNLHCITTVRRCLDRGINMHVVTEVHRLVLDVERDGLGVEEIWKRLNEIKPYHYPRWIVAVMVGFSCACFARLMGADFISCGLVFFASGVAMAFRQQMARWHFNPLVNFACTAFVATSISCQSALRNIGGNPTLAMAASVLLLIPGFPLINAVSDMVKGYVNTGVSRWIMATLLVMSTCVGIVLALMVWRVRVWI